MDVSEEIDSRLIDTLEQLTKARAQSTFTQETVAPVLDQAAGVIIALLVEHSRNMTCAVETINGLEQQLDQLRNRTRALERLITAEATPHGHA